MQAYLNLGNSLRDQGKPRQAVEAYQTAISMKSNNPAAYLNLGTAHQEQDKLGEAIEAYNKAVSFQA